MKHEILREAPVEPPVVCVTLIVSVRELQQLGAIVGACTLYGVGWALYSGLEYARIAAGAPRASVDRHGGVVCGFEHLVD